ncbi:nuclease (SNase domain-containing protein) [Pseudodesulfovibrio mercurii]|uniref:Nuclease (SNase domain-containing protein) n=1 Tax=Pseudodesulfovibrio mercurii TaxID=641491 RepID=F0JI68_9BACT|nr:thermonuclease family protein [Pseudodesulfovibrio mercurii]EGB15379.1 nuclease (SNase domain-containing protein) [Pseudodesulfovibrio mercurii]
MHHRNTLFPRLFVLAIFCVCLGAGLLPACAPAADDTARLVKVLDGDSFRVTYRGSTLEVRLIGVDAPEYRQEYSRKARDFTRDFCQGKGLRLEFDKDPRDRYGRTLAYVYADGVMLNEALVRAGLAVPLVVKPNVRHAERIRQAEAEARQARRGFWSKGGLDMTPAQWRRSHPRK